LAFWQKILATISLRKKEGGFFLSRKGVKRKKKTLYQYGGGGIRRDISSMGLVVFSRRGLSLLGP